MTGTVAAARVELINSLVKTLQRVCCMDRWDIKVKWTPGRKNDGVARVDQEYWRADLYFKLDMRAKDVLPTVAHEFAHVMLSPLSAAVRKLAIEHDAQKDNSSFALDMVHDIEEQIVTGLERTLIYIMTSEGW